MKPITVIGVDLGGTKVQAGRVTGSEVVESLKNPISARAKAELVVEEIVAAINPLMKGEIAGIGVGVPSVVDVKRGIVYAVENIPSWKEVHLKEILERRFHVPVYVNNDANCFAVGELYYGKGQGVRHLVGMTLGTGLGTGVVIDGRLYNGSNCGAGEIGCIPWRDQTIEYYCSGQFFLRENGECGEKIFEHARNGDAAAISVYERFGSELGQAVKIVLYAYDPEMIIFGGSVAAAFDLFHPALRRSLEDFAYLHALERVRLTQSERPDIAILGAAALVLDGYRASLTDEIGRQ